MKMLINSEWLRTKIEAEPEDINIEAGIPVECLQSIRMFLPPNLVVKSIDDQRMLKMKVAFGLMIKKLRLRDGLSIDLLAKKAEIMADELESIECDPHYQARPRTVRNLANQFGVNVPRMMEFSGVANTTDNMLPDEAVKFAAKSNGVSSLNNEEQIILNEFVKLLNKS